MVEFVPPILIVKSIEESEANELKDQFFAVGGGPNVVCQRKDQLE